MTIEDLNYVNELCAAEVIIGPVLELGGGYGGWTCRDAILRHGLAYRATDMHAAPGVDCVANFETGEGLSSVSELGPFGTVLVLNVLEHTFDPAAVLDNAMAVATDDGGMVVAVAPAIWPLHDFPVDACRLLPDWYRWYARTRGLTLVDFRYLGYGNVADFQSPDGQDSFPVAGFGRPRYRFWSRLIHRVFNTFGRGMAQPSYLVIGVVFRRTSQR